MWKTIAPALALMLASQPLSAKVARGGHDNTRVSTHNRSANQTHNVNRNTNVNQNANVNRNVNVNQNVNVNRNVNVNTHGGYGYGYHGGVVVVDDGPDWGAFAAGAAVGAVTGAVVGAATSSNTTTVVQTTAPAATTIAIGSVVGGLPGACAVIGAGAAMVYNCNNIYYRPFYQGTTMMYQVVQYP
jgi:hypothetical protein